MSKTSTFAFVAGAAELLSKGINVSQLSRQRFIDSLVNEQPFKILIDDATKDMFLLDGKRVIRDGRCVYLDKKRNKFEQNLTLDVSKVKQIMEVLYTAQIETFNDFDEKDFIEGFDEKIKQMDAEFYSRLLMKEKLTRENTNEFLRIFLALFDYKNNYSKMLYDDSHIDKSFKLNLKNKYEIVDNRLYIYIKPSDKRKIEKLCGSTPITEYLKDIKAFVISKNIYDYFFASYGNRFQSCFSLSSEYGYCYGYIPFAMADESFICYATTGGVNKLPIISGKQFPCPNMLWRCWGYASENGELLLDKRYKESCSGVETFIKACIDTLISKEPCIIDDANSGCVTKRVLYNNGEGIKKIFNDLNGYFYSDSLRLDADDLYFKYGNGNNSIGSIRYPWTSTHKRFTTFASTIVNVSPSLTLDKPYKIVNGVLLNPKLCPITGLMIDESLDKSPYSKYYTNVCLKSAVLTYINGYVFCDDCTDAECSYYFNIDTSNSCSACRDFAGGKLFAYGYGSSVDPDYKCVSLKSIKEHIKGHIKSTKYDGILLRYFDGADVKYQFYKA